MSGQMNSRLRLCCCALRPQGQVRHHCATSSGSSCGVGDGVTGEFFWNERKSGYVPIALVAIHGNVTFARVGLQKDDCGILLYRRGTRADEVKFIERPREGSVVFARASL